MFNENLEENEVEWVRKAETRKAEILAAGKACSGHSLSCSVIYREPFIAPSPLGVIEYTSALYSNMNLLWAESQCNGKRQHRKQICF